MIFLKFFFILSQPNLVPNPSFEDTVRNSLNCIYPSNLEDCKDCFITYSPRINTPDYFFSTNLNPACWCPINFDGFQYARSGDKYVGIIAFTWHSPYIFVREYISTKLIQPLKKDTYYCASFHVSLSENSEFAIKGIGMYFSQNPITNTYSPFAPADSILFHIFFNLTPQVQSQFIISDTTNWIEIKNAFKAEGDEKYLTIGNFDSDFNLVYNQVKPPTYTHSSSYYYIDDVSLVEITQPQAGPSRTLEVCSGTILHLGNDSVPDAAYEWYPAGGLSCTLCPRPVLTATADAMYVLTKKQCYAELKDTVFIKIHQQGPPAYAGTDAVLCLNDYVQLGTLTPHTLRSHSWTPAVGISCTNCPTPHANPQQSTIYTLTMEECGITSSDEVLVEVEPCELLLPQAITLNDDGKNDALLVKIPFAQKGELRVFNRWGNEVFYTNQGRTLKNHLYFEWDGTHRGKPLPTGVYFYMVEGINIKGEPFTYSQYLHLLR
jgi:gliding motility-associated-like protein